MTACDGERLASFLYECVLLIYSGTFVVCVCVCACFCVDCWFVLRPHCTGSASRVQKLEMHVAAGSQRSGPFPQHHPSGMPGTRSVCLTSF